MNHDGTSRPVDADTLVSVRTRGNAQSGPHRASYWHDEQWVWADRDRSRSDIVEYTVHEAPKAEEIPPEPPPVDEVYRGLREAILAYERDRGIRMHELRIDSEGQLLVAGALVPVAPEEVSDEMISEGVAEIDSIGESVSQDYLARKIYDAMRRAARRMS